MKQVNILEAKTELSRLVREVESGAEDEILIARHGRPIVRMTLFQENPADKRIGIARGKFQVPDDIDRHNEEIAGLFGVNA